MCCLHSYSSPLVQFQLLHSKFHLCSVPTRALILSTYMYIKFINLFPEIKPQIQQILSSDSQSQNGSQELQQRAIEYLQLSTIVTPDVLVRNIVVDTVYIHVAGNFCLEENIYIYIFFAFLTP